MKRGHELRREQGVGVLGFRRRKGKRKECNYNCIKISKNRIFMKNHIHILDMCVQNMEHTPFIKNKICLVQTLQRISFYSST